MHDEGTVNVRPPSPRQRLEKTTYLIGAGFSVPAGLPTMTGFVRAALGVLDEAPRRSLEELIRRYKSLAADFTIDLDNIEDVFAVADSPHSHISQPGDAKLLREAIVRVTAQPTVPPSVRPGAAARLPNLHFRDSSPSGSRWRIPLYTAFVSHLIKANESRSAGTQDGIITTNYDCVIERALADLDGARLPHIAYGCESLEAAGGGTGTGIPLIKLHGSVNWIVENGRVRALDPKQLDQKLQDAYVDFQDFCVVPPTWRKGSRLWNGHPSSGQVLDEAARAAMQQLDGTTRLVIIGYSFPRSDPHIRDLLVHGLSNSHLLPRVEVCDIGLNESEVQKRVAPLLRNPQKVICSLAGVEDFVDQLARDNVR